MPFLCKVFAQFIFKKSSKWVIVVQKSCDIFYSFFFFAQQNAMAGIVKFWPKLFCYID